ncbi:MAG: type 4a pilus biogenesis protein PilO [Patescibacteria group bacterium]|nr:type 4a pilus biogenesis protein PilO [Patescibacteria group bacterium]
MKNSFKRVLSILISVVLLIGSVLIYSNLIKTAYEEAKAQKSELISKEKQYDDMQNIVNQTQNLFSFYQDSAQAQNSISAILPVNSAVPQAVYQISGIAAKNGLRLQTIGSKELAITPSLIPSLIKGVGTLRFSGQLAGSYESFKSFMLDMESNARLFNFSSLKLEKYGGSTGANSLNYNFEIDAYYQTQ